MLSLLVIYSVLQIRSNVPISILFVLARSLSWARNVLLREKFVGIVTCIFKVRSAHLERAEFRSCLTRGVNKDGRRQICFS